MKEDLDKFEKAQNLAYEATSSVMKLLYEGITEKEAAGLLDTYCRDSEVASFFHKPFAWFGDRTRFLNFKSQFNFLPSHRRLNVGDVVILDVAPILQGHVADVGHTFIFGKEQNPDVIKAKKLLLKLRKDLPGMFMSSISTKEIWEKVDDEIKENGFDNIHQLYPFSVLGHRVRKVPLGHLPGITIPFGWHSLWSLASHGLFSELLGPKHKGSKVGVWAIEPHIGGKDFGAKFEELLVVDDSGRAFWLSENVPHLKEGWLTT